MMKRALLLFAAVAGSLQLSAQGFGVEVGGSFSTFSATINGAPAQTSLKPGVKVVITREESINDHLAFQYGVGYTGKGGYLSNTTDGSHNGLSTRLKTDGYMRADYVEMPFSILYHTRPNHKNSFFAGVGGYVGLAFGGLVSIEQERSSSLNTQRFSTLYPATIGSNPGWDDFHMGDAGAGVQLGYEFASGIFTRAAATYGFIDIHPSPNVSLRNRSLSLTVGYMIR